MKNINIVIPSLLENIRMIESFIDNAKERFHFNDDIYGNIMIAVTEAVSNAIKHGNGGNVKKNVSLTLSLEDSLVSFRVEDEGEGFDFYQLPDPTAPENIENLSGRGIFLMRHLSDEVKFFDNGRTVELFFYIS